MRHFLSAALAISLSLVAGMGAAQEESAVDHGVVVELFTSQGCSVCPPADELLARLAQRPGVIALALHVDYWDYIGWRDKFAKPEFTARQKDYARAEGSRSVYTPQMIVAGIHRVNGLRPMELADLIREEGAQAPPVDIELRRSGTMLEIHLRAETALGREVLIDLLRYRERDRVDISAGENAGRSVTYHNIVTSWTTLGKWGGSGQLSFHVRVEGDEPIVVLVQENGPGRILSAARLR